MEKKHLGLFVSHILVILATFVLLVIVIRPGLLGLPFAWEERYRWIRDVMEHSTETYRELPADVGGLMESYPWSDKENLLLSLGLAEQAIAGVKVKPVNDTLLLEGTAEEAVWAGITTRQFQLEPGIYYISSGISSHEVFCYLEGWDEGTSYWQVENLGENVFCVTDPNAFSDGYRFTMYVDGGQTVDQLRLSPRLVKLADLSEEMKWMGIHIWSGVSREKWNALSQKQQKFLLNVLCRQSPDCEWASVVFDDGTGIEYRDGKLMEGRTRMLGMVE